MYKNIIFDIGGVLLTWNPESYIRKILGIDVDAEFFSKRIFKSFEWRELDRGSYTVKELHKTYLKMYPKIRYEINLLMERWFEIINPINENITLIPKLKENGYNLFIISNYVQEAIEEMKTKHAFFDYFNGMVISCYVNHIKPEREIFDSLLEKYKLNVEECILIDDSPDNTEAAEKIGIKSILYLSPEQLKEDLMDLKIKL
ncbi:MAG: HAD family phosphatase [Candidatus Heimdallarchaeota archaeon]|nr:HAD family phosphatase [Candidatus Heimdallarchaeota archaeon]